MSAKVIDFKRPEPKVVEPPKAKYPLPPDPAKTGILPCPFCGSAPRLANPEKVGAGSIDVACYIACSNEKCNVMTPYFYKKNNDAFSEAIATWNRRVR